MKTKICSRCKNEKPLSEFYTSDSHSDGYQPVCKECCKKRGKNRNGSTGNYKSDIENFSDQQLIDELRKRGCTVNATKKVIRYEEISL